jgi:hypothetical protein
MNTKPTIDAGPLIAHSLLHRLRGRKAGDEGAESFERVRGSLVFKSGSGIFYFAGVFEMLRSSSPDPLLLGVPKRRGVSIERQMSVAFRSEKLASFGSFAERKKTFKNRTMLKA